MNPRLNRGFSETVWGKFSFPHLVGHILLKLPSCNSTKCLQCAVSLGKMKKLEERRRNSRTKTGSLFPLAHSFFPPLRRSIFSPSVFSPLSWTRCLQPFLAMLYLTISPRPTFIARVGKAHHRTNFTSCKVLTICTPSPLTKTMSVALLSTHSTSV